MIKKHILIILIILLYIVTLTGCSKNTNDNIYGGYSEAELTIEKDSNYYISGYSGGRYYTYILDYQKVKAFYLNYKGEEVLMISIDCVGLTSNYINQIRDSLNFNFPVNIVSTHTHAGVDTMGLWGPVGINGKSNAFMEKLVHTAIQVGKEAYSSSTTGLLTYGSIETNDILRDSREPIVYDKNIYQLRFIPNNNQEGTRLVFYGAHAESLGGSNTKISADFPSVMSKVIKEKTNDNMLYFPGAIGGLICTNTFDENDIENNMKITGNKLAEYVLKIKEENITSKKLKQKTVNFKIRLDNTIFLYYKFLGILENNITKNPFNNTYYVKTELSVIQIDKVTIVLIPGEIFPELVWGGTINNPDLDEPQDNPNSLIEIANKYNINNLIIVGLANDEIGYIIPPSDFLVSKEYPYIVNIEDSKNENHYEETMSVGKTCAYEIANAFEKCLKKLK